MAAVRGLHKDLDLVADHVQTVDHDLNELTRVVLRPMVRVELGVNRLLTHLGLTPVTDADIDAALGISPDTTDTENDDEV